jgi:hypothetical protein
VFEALQTLKSAYHNEHIVVVDQASQHANALIASLEGTSGIAEADIEVDNI